MPKDKLEDEAIPMSQVLKSASSTIEQDAMRRSTDIDFGDLNLGPVEGEQPPPVATEQLTIEADVPYYSVTDGIGRDIMTKIAEGERRLSELASDLELSRLHRDTAISQAEFYRDQAIERAEEQCRTVSSLIDNNHLQETAILRGRETDVIKGVSTLKATLEMLQRK